MAGKRRFSILGNSISTFEGCNPLGFRVFYEGERLAATGVREPRDTWWAQVVDALGGEVLVNGSFSGSMVEGAGFPAGDSAERIAALARDGRVPDVILAFIGINDYGWGGADAQAAGRGNALPVCLDVDELGEQREPGLAIPDAADRFGVAYESMLARMRAAYPQAEVWCCTLCPGRVAGRDESTFAYRLRGVHFDRYNDAIRAAARAHGCRVADVRALGRDYEGLDGTHPTARGMRQFASLVLRAMAAEGTEATSSIAQTVPSASCDAQATPSATPVPQAAAVAVCGLDPLDPPPSAERCPEPSCIGCPYAASTSDKWLLVCNKDTAASTAAPEGTPA